MFLKRIPTLVSCVVLQFSVEFDSQKGFWQLCRCLWNSLIQSNLSTLQLFLLNQISNTAILQHRLDILAYSIITKTKIIVKVTCPCKENMESWHATKFGKYNPLFSGIKTNGWSVQFFAVEVGALGYCPSTIRSCLARLGLTRKFVRSSQKTLSSVAVTASFQVWHCRESWE